MAVAEITRDRALLAQTRLRHRAHELLARFVPSAWANAEEFEWRYRRYLAEFGEAESDVYVSTFSKSGTTWMQMILYQLTTSGEMTFDHLFDVSPWIWYSALRQVPPAVTPGPRLLKSHDDYRRFRTGLSGRATRAGRVVFVVRDGRDVCISLYHHRVNFKGFTGTFDEHFEDFLHGTDYNWFEHLAPWIRNDAGLPILYVRYEDLKERFDQELDRIASFLGLQPSTAVLERVHERTTFRAMKEHEHRLGPRDEHFSGDSRTPYRVKNPDQFIRHGRVGEGLELLSTRQLDDYRRRFDRTLRGIPLLEAYR